MYSSIEESSRLEVIQNCYWPLLKLAEIGVPIGIEAPAVTLEIINELDPKWISSLSKYIAEGKIEFIGSGYSQIIGPLVPAKVNTWNQQIGLGKYNDLLGVKPKLALVNEMAYSGGIGEHYINAGYDGLIMEWNNPRSAHPEWENEWRYFPQKAIAFNGETIPLLWADSIAFQKFQRYVHGEYTLKEYADFIKSQVGNKARFFPLYSNDVEIFDYRPGRYKTEAKFNGNSEWDRIIEYYSHLKQKDWCEFIFPSQVLSGLNNEMSGKELKLESPSQPIPVKKQEKYNINRWALTGRDDLGINTKCYKIYNSLVANDNSDPEDWKELCYLWSSDFRTHITEMRWNEYLVLLEETMMRSNTEYGKSGNSSRNNQPYSISEDPNQYSFKSNEVEIVLNKRKGLTIKEFIYKNSSDKFLFGTLEHGYFDDISLGYDYFSGHAIIDIPGEHKVTDLIEVKPKITKTKANINFRYMIEHGAFEFENNIYIDSKKLIFKKTIKNFSEKQVIIHPFNFTFNPKAWDRESLFIQTHNGGTSIEKYHLNNQSINHGNIYSHLISAVHGFGNTEGIFVVGDKDKSITFECDMTSSALIPSIIYKELGSTYFFRLQYSAIELDETRKVGQIRKRIQSKLSIFGNG